jgi:excisionase family DNA binding protein
VTPADLRREAAALETDAAARAARLRALADDLERQQADPLSRDLTLREAAARLNVSRPYVSELCLRGELTFVRVGRRGVRVPAQALEEYRKRKLHGPRSIRSA